MDAIAVQRQIRENASTLQNYYSDLKDWEATIAKKEQARSTSTKKPPRVRNAVAVPVRGSAGSVSIQHPINDVHTPAHEPVAKAAPASHVYDTGYKKWDAFDVRPHGPSTGAQEGGRDQGCAADADNLAGRARKSDGNMHFKAGEYVAAVACYTRSLGFNPRNHIVLSNRAMAHLKLKEYIKAEQDATLALQYDSRHVKSLSRRATARNALGKHRLALCDAEAALALEPTNKTIALQLKTTREALKTAVKRTPSTSIPVTVTVAPTVAPTVAVAEPPAVSTNEAPTAPTDKLPLPVAAPPSTKLTRPKIKVLVPTKAPTTSYEFQRVWKSFQHADEMQQLRRTYLGRLQVALLPKLFKDAIEPDLLLEILDALSVEMDANAVALLMHLARVPRFDMVVRFFSGDERQHVASVLAQASAVEGCDAAALKAAYGV
ncbi:hypothetical protein SPRG_09799 [Saprolegnia parasitica CBS 223.65]|uniref:RNA polymerase II-associated protein 3 n=1 Tax=Saprolegnia parasitica (strain CBS 223.65) TaxID=695850 RepID=A0A067C5I7_SAPPC|nr:hypothetical protein SPRG_09799 [Saprolegnia parasitica CBS 223.65]KDO24410.1 hypothetical protein SPRG_09799 [Saprolegnia parasitica CBS 223.65]|eukprot:XP_012204840.1 hypothetical protein SPRG_09799 [Saprolegnia parasitica CBS 223.65]